MAKKTMDQCLEEMVSVLSLFSLTVFPNYHLQASNCFAWNAGPLLTATNSHPLLLNALSFRYHHTPSHNSGLTSASTDLFPFTLISSLTRC